MISETVIPAEVANRIFAGEHPVRVYRDWRGLKAKDFAAAVGMSAGHLSDIQSGRRNRLDHIRIRIAGELGVEPEDLIPATMD